MTTTCEMCSENVAAVFTPTMALCRQCKRDADRMALDDYPVPNAPTCPVDGSVLSRHGTCSECYTRTVLVAHVGRAS